MLKNGILALIQLYFRSGQNAKNEQAKIKKKIFNIHFLNTSQKWPKSQK